VGLTAGYWPEDSYRYLAIPGIALDEALLTRPARRRANHPAVITPQATLPYRELAAACDAVALRLAGRGSGRVAICVREEVAAVKFFFAALRARWVLFPVDPRISAEEAVRRLRLFQPDLIVSDLPAVREAARRALAEATVTEPGEIEEGEAAKSLPRGRLDLQQPVVALTTEDGILAYHSHKSLLAAAVSWSSFVPLKAEDVFLSLEPLSSWEGLYGLLPLLFRGGTSLLCNLVDPEKAARLISAHHPSYTILPRMEARKLYTSSYRPLVGAFREHLQGLFVSTQGPFTALGRRRLRNLIGKPALLAFGSAEAGIVFSSHPSWYLDAAVGIPVTNADVWPLNPQTGNPLEVPWEAIEHAEVGVKSPMCSVGYSPEGTGEARVRDGWLRTWIVATMDPNGLFYILSRVPDSRQAA
jgi:acyl-CoA synthetase (AMP-forming)/AMP-acid ligase II